MAKDERGTKREDPDTGKKFYDLNKDPIVSPYTGKSYPRSYFDAVPIRAKAAAKRDEDEEEEELEVEETAEPGAPEVISLEDADAEESGGDDEGEDIPDVEDVEDVEDIGEDEDVFLEEDEDEDEDLDFDVGSGKDDER